MFWISLSPGTQGVSRGPRRFPGLLRTVLRDFGRGEFFAGLMGVSGLFPQDFCRLCP